MKPGAKLIMAANTVDKDPVGSPYYRTHPLIDSQRTGEFHEADNKQGLELHP